MAGTPIVTDTPQCFFAKTGIEVEGDHRDDILRAGGGKEFQRTWPGLAEPTYYCRPCRQAHRSTVVRRPTLFKMRHGDPRIVEDLGVTNS